MTTVALFCFEFTHPRLDLAVSNVAQDPTAPPWLNMHSPYDLDYGV